MDRRKEAAIGLGKDWPSEEPRLPGDMNLDTKSAEPSFSQRWPSSYRSEFHLTDSQTDGSFKTSRPQ